MNRKEETSIKDYGSTSNELLYEEDEMFEEDEQVEKKQKKKKKKKKKSHRCLRVIAILLSLILFIEAAYCFLVFTDISEIKYYREAFIETALSTMTHSWLARYTLPEYMVEHVRQREEYLRKAQEGIVSDQSDRVSSTEEAVTEPTDITEPNVSAETVVPEDEKEEAFYELFWELNRTSFEEYLDSHPSVLDNGWDHIYINEAGQDDEGTEIYTTMGEQVLAIDVENKLLLVRVSGTGYIGILAIGKDPSQLRVEASEGIGSYGQDLGVIVDNNDGVIGITGSGFYDPNGGGNGGTLAGYAMCEGTEYGVHYEEYGYKRIELTKDNKMYIVESDSPVGDDVTDAVEFMPALIVDGNVLVSDDNSWVSINPRAAIGQSDKGEILMLIIEGRLTGRSIGAGLDTCAAIFKRHDCYTAMNLDGGTSAVMYYRGEYVTKCSNKNLVSRYLPNAWVYGNYE